MELESLFGLPAHPLLVHAAVVLLPLAAIATLVTALVPRWRRAYAPLALGLALAATVSVGLAQGSGEALEEHVDETELVEEHTEKGETVLPWAIGVTVVAGAVVAADRLRDRNPQLSAPAVTGALLVGSLLVGVGATYAIVEVGHSGAKATWDEEIEDGGGADGGDEEQGDDEHEDEAGEHDD